MTSKAAQSLGSKGGKARAKKLTAKRRSEIAKQAGIASGKVRIREVCKPTRQQRRKS